MRAHACGMGLDYMEYMLQNYWQEEGQATQGSPDGSLQDYELDEDR